MTFKQNWEKADDKYFLPQEVIGSIINYVYPNKKIHSSQITSGGCANINIKIYLQDEKPFILRIYLRDKEAACKEQKIGILLKPIIPVPYIYYVGDFNKYRFAITEFMEGISLRDLILSNKNYNLRDIMYEVGFLLANFTCYKFSHAGFLDNELKIKKL